MESKEEKCFDCKLKEPRRPHREVSPVRVKIKKDYPKKKHLKKRRRFV